MRPPSIKRNCDALLVWLMAMSCAAEFASAQGVRLELRLVPQSGVPWSCVFDDPVGSSDVGGVVAVSPSVAKRFEVQYRLIDTDATDGVSPAGLGDASISVRVIGTESGLWGRARLSAFEVVRASATPPGDLDCGGIVTEVVPSRGMHRPFRGLLVGPTPPNNDAAVNGTITPNGILNIQPFSFAVNDQGRPPGTQNAWYGLYSFEFTAPAGFAGQLTLRVDREPSFIPFNWFEQRTDALTVRRGSMDSIGASVTLESPASSTGCCRGGSCYIALTPSACFANAGRLSLDGVCGAISCCTGDFNGDGVLGPQDLFDYLAEWFVFSPRAELDAMNGVTTGDLFVFLGAYLVGCG